MAVFKCKMCGGNLNVEKGQTVCTCEYCGTKQTVPNIDDEKRVRLYDRANHFRRENEYDKAMGIYESILAEDEKDAEAYWGIVLCKYGIEYVEDPKTKKRVPTVNRAQYTSVFIDEDYQKAIKYADGYQRDIYEAEAKAIDDIQKGILAISNKEDPFDIFICYKETDDSGRRTQDSVYAQNIYKELTKEGYKVFFSRITLEDKLGTEYEPYIFAALNSSPVMIVVGTSAENFNAVWVKNEWSRYLALIKGGAEKTLIPVYKDMDPYDLPEEFAYIQAQDMNKVGFMQDLIRGIKKIISHEVIDERQKKSTSSVIVDTMKRRASDALANKDWDTAKRCYDSILDYDSNNADALIGRMKAERQVQDLRDTKIPLDLDPNYEKILSLADEKTRKEVEEINKANNEVIAKTKAKNKRITIILVIAIAVIITCGILAGANYNSHIKPFFEYKSAVSELNKGEYNDAKNKFSELGNYKDSKKKVTECNNGIKYTEAVKYMKEKNYSNAIIDFKELADLNYKDSKEKYIECNYLYGCEYLNKNNYADAKNSLDYFNNCKNYKDTPEKIKQAEKIVKDYEAKQSADNYKLGQQEMDNGNYEYAVNTFEGLNDYKDSKEKAKLAKYKYVLQYKGDIDKVSSTESLFYNYLKALCNANYKDSKSIYNSLYNNWKFKCWVNDSYESSKSKTNIDRNETVYVHVQSTAGPLSESNNLLSESSNEEIKLKFVYYTFNSSDGTYNESMKDEETITPFGSTYSTVTHTFYVANSSGTNYYVEISYAETGEIIDKIDFHF